jgi:hypothetical protein
VEQLKGIPTAAHPCTGVVSDYQKIHS